MVSSRGRNEFKVETRHCARAHKLWTKEAAAVVLTASRRGCGERARHDVGQARRLGQGHILRTGHRRCAAPEGGAIRSVEALRDHSAGRLCYARTLHLASAGTRPLACASQNSLHSRPKVRPAAPRHAGHRPLHASFICPLGLKILPTPPSPSPSPSPAAPPPPAARRRQSCWSPRLRS